MRRGANNRKRVPADDVAEVQRAERRREAWRMRTLEGASFRAIAAKLGVSLDTVAKDVARARDECKPEGLDEMRKEASEHLEHIRDQMLELASADPQAASAAIKAIAEHAKLNGLHAPTKTELTGSLSINEPTPAQAREAIKEVFRKNVEPYVDASDAPGTSEEPPKT